MSVQRQTQGSALDSSARGEYRASLMKVMIYGNGASKRLPDIIKELGGTKAFIITGRSLFEKTPVIRKIEQLLELAHGGTYSKIGQHAPIKDIKEATNLMTESGCDVLISIGGGSPIDSAKAIAYNVHQKTGKWIPNVAVPTTLSVAETTQNAGYTDEDGHKVSLRNPELVPKAVVYDGELALHTPIDLWTSTGMRALDHAIELMYHPLASEYPTKRLCLEAIADIFTYLPQSKSNPEDTSIRTKLFIACYAALFPFLFSGGVGLSHSIGHAIGATYSIPHGMTSCLSLAPVLYFKSGKPDEARQIARIVSYIGKQSSARDDDDAQTVAEAVAKLVEQLGHKTSLTAYNVPLGDAEEEAIALRVLKSKEHEDFASVKSIIHNLY